jgi:enoyl-CoA hydratase
VSLRVEEIDEGQIVRLSLASGRGNPLTPDLVASLKAQVEAMRASPPRVVVLDGGGGSIFSGGFSLPDIARWERPQIKSFFRDFMAIVYGLMEIPCPVVAGMGGHAIAGGFILSLAADFRIIGDSGLKFGLSEVDLGVAVPAGALALLRARVGSAAALQLAASGRLIIPQEAKMMGYADELVFDPETRAIHQARKLLQKPGRGSGVTCQFHSRPIVAEMRAAEAACEEAFLDTWFSEEAQTALHRLADRLSGRSKRG